MLVIRLFRTGKKNQPSFKIVVIDKKKSSTKGPYVEEVGFWNPLTKKEMLKQDRIKYWLSVGARPSPTVHNLLVSEKIIEGRKKPIYMKKKQKETEVKPAETKLVEEKPKEDNVVVEEPKENKIEEKLAEEKSKEEALKEEKEKMAEDKPIEKN